MTTTSARTSARHPARLAAGALMTLALSVSLAACGSSSGDSTSSGSPSATGTFAAGTTMERLATAKKITVGTKFDQPGFGLQGLNGKPAGFDVEIAKLVAHRLGLTDDQITYVETPSASREEAIEQGRADIVAATYTINDKRKQRVSFAGPYYEAGQSVMVGKDETAITGPESLKAQPTAKVCSVAGSTPAETIKTYLAAPDQLVTFDNYSKCVDALKTGQVRAVTTDNVILLGYISKSNGAYKLVGTPFTKEPYGIGLKKGDTAFCTFVNETLQQASTSGDYEKAWTSTAGKLSGAQTPTLPTLGTCA